MTPWCPTNENQWGVSGNRKQAGIHKQCNQEPFHDISRRESLSSLASKPVSRIWSQWRQLLEGLLPTSLHLSPTGRVTFSAEIWGAHWPARAWVAFSWEFWSWMLKDVSVGMDPNCSWYPGTMVNPKISLGYMDLHPKSVIFHRVLIASPGECGCPMAFSFADCTCRRIWSSSSFPKKGVIPTNHLQFWRIPHWNSGIKASWNSKCLKMENKTHKTIVRPKWSWNGNGSEWFTDCSPLLLWPMLSFQFWASGKLEDSFWVKCWKTQTNIKHLGSPTPTYAEYDDTVFQEEISETAEDQTLQVHGSEANSPASCGWCQPDAIQLAVLYRFWRAQDAKNTCLSSDMSFQIIGHVWLYMAIYGYIWLYMAIYGYIWLLSSIISSSTNHYW